MHVYSYICIHSVGMYVSKGNCNSIFQVGNRRWRVGGRTSKGPLCLLPWLSESRALPSYQSLYNMSLASCRQQGQAGGGIASLSLSAASFPPYCSLNQSLTVICANGLSVSLLVFSPPFLTAAPPTPMKIILILSTFFHFYTFHPSFINIFEVSLACFFLS